MSLFDTIDGAFMNFAYGWAFSQPVRKIFYNITVTGLSVVVALLIGTIELMSVLADKLSLTGQPWDFVSTTSTSTWSATRSSGSSCSPGRSRSRSGASATSRRSGRRTVRSTTRIGHGR